MTATVLATKLHMPPPRAALVPRARLLHALTGGLHRPLTVIAAPAGFGKTTLVSAWATEADRPVAWVSLDERDGELAIFLLALIAALQRLDPRIGVEALNALVGRAGLPLEALLTLLLNDLAAHADPLVIVLDDYHALNSPAVDAALAFVIDHLPPTVHIMIATREDPAIPLARLRARDQLNELRIADLRFTPAEAADFLRHAMHLDLVQADIDLLHARTEGWAAGLHLAALAARQRADAADFIHAFTGAHRFVLDYLVEEVLTRQPEPMQRFLLRTAVLERLCGPLCDALGGFDPLTGQGALETGEAANLLLVPLDDERRWFRYHHLFGEMLRARLTRLHPDQVPMLHERASAWYAANGFPFEAIHHAFAAGDIARAAALIEQIWPTVRRTRQEAGLLRWVRALPDAIVRQRPVLSAVCAWVLMDAGEYAAAESRLDDAERLIAAPSPDQVIVDEAQFRSLPAAIANARAYIAQARGDIPAVVRFTRLALDLLPEWDHYERGTTAALLGLAYWTQGDLAAGYAAFAAGLDDLERGGGLAIRMGGTVILGQVLIAQGGIDQATALFAEWARRAEGQGEPLIRGTAEMWLGMADASLERGNFAQAERQFAAAKALRDRASLPGYDAIWCTVEARLRWAQGDFDAAFALMDEAERRWYRSPIPDVQPIAAQRARLYIAAGRLTDAAAWANARGLTAHDALSYLREYEHLTLARLLIAQAGAAGGGRALTEARALLARLRQAADSGGRAAIVREIDGLLAALHGPMATASAPLIDPLSARELDVLRLFSTELSGPEIADALGVALSTVRSHTKHIYDKLGVTSRRAALNRAEDLGLI